MAGYDTIKFKLWHSECGGVNFMEETLKYIEFDRPYPVIDKESGEFLHFNYGGYLGNLYVMVSPEYVSVENPLCKYHKGNNIEELTLMETKDAIEKISDSLHLPMERALVIRLDIGANLQTKYFPNMYFPSLGELKRFSRKPEPNGITYKTKGAKRAVGAYDKKLEAKDAGEPIPESYLGCNLLRLEYRFYYLSKWERQRIGYDPITAGMLSNENFYICVNDLWRAVYMDIEKIRNVKQIEFDMKTIKDFNKLAVCRCIVTDFGGMEGFMERLNISQKRGDITRKQKSDLLKNANKAMEYAGQIVKVENTVEELDKLVNDNWARSVSSCKVQTPVRSVVSSCNTQTPARSVSIRGN